jgi:monovalent cation:H+ antiporter-2, CPA2 family
MLRDLLVICVVALACVVGLGRLRVPSLVALVVAGLLAGPTGFGFVTSTAETEVFAEIGVALLLFTVGLDFSLTEVRRVLRPALIGGSLQMLGTAAVVALVASLIGTSVPVSVFLGAFVALSSTAVVLKVLTERNQVDAPQGRLMVAVLILQDLAIVALLLLVPILAGHTALSAVPLTLLRGLAAIAVVAVASRILLPLLMRLALSGGKREGFALALVLASLGTAWVAALLGLSMAMGAFLAGLVLAESEFGLAAQAEIKSVRDVLGGLFFVSLGMLVDPAVLGRQAGLVLLLALALIVGKALVASLALAAAAQPLRLTIAAGFGLAQVGEFSFVLGKAGLEQGIIDPHLWQLLLAASILTMAVTPLLISAGEALGSSWGAARGGISAPAESRALRDHVVILGFGLGGQLVARALREAGVPYVVLELNGATVRRHRALNEPIVYGDASQPDTLQAVSVERARAVVSLLNDPLAAERVARTLSQVAKDVPFIVRTRYWLEAQRIRALGARVAVAGEIETSLEVVAQLLAALGLPGNAIEEQLERLRTEVPGQRRVAAPGVPLQQVPLSVEQTPVTTHRLGVGDWAVGRTVAEVDLRARTGVLVISLEADRERLSPPPADRRLLPGDVLYLLGTGASIAEARQRLSTGGAMKEAHDP